MRLRRCIPPESSFPFSIYLLLLFLLLTFHSGTVLTTSTVRSNDSFVTIDADSKARSTSADEITSLFTPQTVGNSIELDKERDNTTYGHVTPHSFSTSGEFRNVSNEIENGTTEAPASSPVNSETVNAKQIITPTGKKKTHHDDVRLSNELMNSEVQNRPQTQNEGGSRFNSAQRSSEPARMIHLQRGEPAQQSKDRNSLEPYFGEGLFSEDDVRYEDGQSYRDLRFGSDNYGSYEDSSSERTKKLSHEDLFKDYEGLLFEEQSRSRLNYSDLPLAKGKDWLSRDNRIEYEDLYDSHLIQDIPEKSSVVRRRVSLRGRLSSDRINISLIVIYGWLLLVLLTIITALLVIRYKHKFSSECPRISKFLQLGGSCKGNGVFDEGNDLLAQPLV